jgi:hypothetical protein
MKPSPCRGHPRKSGTKSDGTPPLGGLVNLPGSIESIPDRSQFYRVANVFVDRHLQQLAGHAVGSIFETLACLGFHLRRSSTV